MFRQRPAASFKSKVFSPRFQRVAMTSDDSFRQAENVALLHAIIGGFVARPAHPVADIRQFEKLVLGLLDLVDDASAAAALRPLLSHPEAPPAVFDRLRAKGGLCAALAIELTPGAAVSDLLSASRQPHLARAIARRGDLDRALVGALTLSGDAETLRALAANLSLRFDAAARRALLRAARDDRGLARLLIDRGDFDADRETLFLAATRAERRAIVLEACRRALAAGPVEARIAHPALVDRLEAAAARSDRMELATVLCDSFGCGKERTRALLTDRQGEPLALALAALGVPPAAATRIIMSAGALISHDPVRVRSLVALVRAIPKPAAERLIVAMTGAEKPERGAVAARPFPRREAAAAPARQSAGVEMSRGVERSA
jgi:uncharacterized protein (DUF2336 family)